MSKKSFNFDCPRCGSHSFEQMSDYAHCPNCLYFEDRYEDSETCYAVIRALDPESLSNSIHQNSEDLDKIESLAS